MQKRILKDWHPASKGRMLKTDAASKNQMLGILRMLGRLTSGELGFAFAPRNESLPYSVCASFVCLMKCMILFPGVGARAARLAANGSLGS
jgi:hypothetical protein